MYINIPQIITTTPLDPPLIMVYIDNKVHIDYYFALGFKLFWTVSHTAGHRNCVVLVELECLYFELLISVIELNRIRVYQFSRFIGRTAEIREHWINVMLRNLLAYLLPWF